MRDYYQVLGVDKTISQKNLKKHYYQLAKKYHPDMAPKEKRKASADRFKAISQAYDALSTPARRKRYDAGGLGANYVYSSGFSTSKPKKELILSKLNANRDFSIEVFAHELRVSYSNLEKILTKFFLIFNIGARIEKGQVIF